MTTLGNRIQVQLDTQNDFFPCFDWVFPPPVLTKDMPERDAVKLFSREAVEENFSLYVHIPFCKTLCSFCYYAVIPKQSDDEINKYIEYLTKEILMYREALKGQVCESIYIGGGTPTYLTNKQLDQLFKAIHQAFDIQPKAEITVESAPGTLSPKKVEHLVALGVNRISYGIQTLDAKLLAKLNRFYSVPQALKELQYALSRIGNINIDTMYGFEEEEDDTLIKSLDTFVRLGIPALSIYSLDTQRNDRGKVACTPEKDKTFDWKLNTFRKASEFLFTNGFEQILQNIFVKKPQGSYIHQLRRWDNLPVVAVGINSQGYAPKRPYQNAQSVKSYFELINENLLPIVVMDQLSPEMEMARELTSKLRFMEVDCKAMANKNMGLM